MTPDVVELRAHQRDVRVSGPPTFFVPVQICLGFERRQPQIISPFALRSVFPRNYGLGVQASLAYVCHVYLKFARQRCTAIRLRASGREGDGRRCDVSTPARSPAGISASVVVHVVVVVERSHDRLVHGCGDAGLVGLRKPGLVSELRSTALKPRRRTQSLLRRLTCGRVGGNTSCVRAVAASAPPTSLESSPVYLS